MRKCQSQDCPLNKGFHIPLHTESIHSAEAPVAVCQGPENKVTFTLLFSFFLTEASLEGREHTVLLVGLLFPIQALNLGPQQ